MASRFAKIVSRNVATNYAEDDVMTSQQFADRLLAEWQTLWPLPPAERIARIEEIRRSMPRASNDDDTPEQSIVRREFEKDSSHV